MFFERIITQDLKEIISGPVAKGLVLTGARQTGKTTLLQREFSSTFEYHSFDEALSREQITRIPAADWLLRGKSYIFDEVQKAPAFLGTLKTFLDRAGPDQRLILSGSAQIQLLSGIRETLAGRVATRELYPLTIAELVGEKKPMLLDLLACGSSAEVRRLLVETSLAISRPEASAARSGLEHYLTWGGMPPVKILEDESHRWLWLEEYCQTYLQRDVADLGRVAEFDDFFRFERIAARRSASVVNYSDLARDADLSPLTAKKYLRYLELSYHAFLLGAWSESRGVRLIKSPRLHWVDPGVQRVLSGLRQGMTGPQFESAMVGEIYKYVRSLRLPVELYYLRTKDGREVDLLARSKGGGLLAFEMKISRHAAPHDARHLRGLERLLGTAVLAGLVIYQGDTVEIWDNNFFAVPAAALFLPGPS